MPEKFNNQKPLNLDGVRLVEIEKGYGDYEEYKGTLYFPSQWFTVAQARALRDWLNEALPK
jgi:hypothetical protein